MLNIGILKDLLKHNYKCVLNTHVYELPISNTHSDIIIDLYKSKAFII